MHICYKEVSPADLRRILDYCRRNTVKNGGLFEVYSTPGEDVHMVVVNSCAKDNSVETLRPLGAFYCNYLRLGTISIDDEEPGYDGMESRKRHVKAIKQVIDILLRDGHPGTKIKFNPDFKID
ncbi:MAG: hypothetical protein A3K09_04610 [Nitrospinae bacterium RIFCSPLOWO2_12_FULL_47_7]|nr:MAG: hypothetical protein A3K09_04610 [Nitrospinae bacterium RIFCSPLOWO2_12_FULL_47_7]